uniref:protein phosphatase methylesterase-1 n=1 Tax=Henneguya salminicola TaxID=69463 RepID=A0A6G3MFZ1_HENSL
MDEPREILERKMMSDLTEKELLNELKVINLEDCSPLSWDKYFSQELYVNTNNGRFHILYAGEAGPVIFLIHGAGSSAQTWCLFARELLKQVQVRVVAMDLRGHGLSTTDSDHDFNKNVLVNDIIDVINRMMVMLHINENIVLVGHSLGGALATWVATLSLNHHLSGLVVIDVDEQAALDQKSMFEHLISRPTSFSSIEKAIKYSYLNRKLSNLEADRLSIPGQLKKVSNKQEFVWKVDLFETKQFWKGFSIISHLRLVFRIF